MEGSGKVQKAARRRLPVDPGRVLKRATGCLEANPNNFSAFQI
jgi:hypothetical protein